MNNSRLILLALSSLQFTHCKPQPTQAPETKSSSGPAPSPTSEASHTDVHNLLNDKLEANRAAVEMTRLHKMLMTWSLDNAGNFPPDLDALIRETDKYGFDAKWLEELKPGIIEYRGKNLSFGDDGQLVLLRFRPGQQTRTEVRMLVNGSYRAVPSDTPIPEDASR